MSGKLTGPMWALVLLLALSWGALLGALLLLRRHGRRAEHGAVDPSEFGALPWAPSAGGHVEPAHRRAPDAVRREPAGTYNGSNGAHLASGVADAHVLRSGIFAALYGNVVALDAKGIIIAVNRSWVEFARANGADPDRVSVGADYLKVCQVAAAMGDADGRQAEAMIAAALRGVGGVSRLEYTCPSPTGQRWFEMSVEPLDRREGGALVSHFDITRQRLAEEAAWRHADDLAHAQRVGALGDLAAALAHEINQPLAAIVANAQATIRVLEAAAVAPADSIAALADIAEDGKRASQIIQRLRALFSNEHGVREAVPINELVDRVVSLLDGERRRRDVSVRASFDPRVPAVLGDPVQLQQVVLNVFLNALDAIGEVGAGNREISLVTHRREPDLVEISVRDTGVGVKDGDLERIFERYFTTKTEGLGMGLSISRSIVHAHGGRIWARSNEGGGTTVVIELPSKDRSVEW
jgi:signal transduction histidine kinase